MRFEIVSALAALLAAAAAPVLSPVAMAQGTTRAYMVEPFTPAAPVSIVGTGVRLRAEPFATNDTPVLSSGSTGLKLTVVGIARQPDWDWYQVILRNGQKAFIRSDLTSAPSRGGGMSAAHTPVVAAPVTQPAAPVYVPTAPTPIPTITPAPAAQPLPSIPVQPLNNSGVISLTPSTGAPATPAQPSVEPVDNGLISVSPSAPSPTFSSPAPSTSATPLSSSTPLPSTVTNLGVAEQIRAQLNINRCWTDSSNMMDAQRLKATFAVSFNPAGRFAVEPRLVEPAAEPVNDPAMMVFIAKARAALRTCNALGFQVPAEYASSGGGEVRLEFSAR